MTRRLFLTLSFMTMMGGFALAQSAGITSNVACPPNTICNQDGEVLGPADNRSNGTFTNELPRQSPPPPKTGGDANNGTYTNELPRQPFPPPPKPRPRLADISCYVGYQVLQDAGFRRIWAYDCIGTVFRYRGIRGGTEYQIGVRKSDGQIIWSRILG